MDWLMHNPVADMYGPHFLILYGSVIIATLMVCWSSINLRDPTKNLSPPLVPANPDPYEIAYLQGGENQLIRVIILNLIQRQYLQVTKTPRLSSQSKTELGLAKASKPPDPRHLSPMERKVFEGFTSFHSAHEIFQSPLPAYVKSHCTGYDQKFQNEKLFYPVEVKEKATRASLIGALVIIGLGGYKFCVALAKGHTNVGFLIIMGIVGLVLLFKICRPPRLSSRGKVYLERLQRAFEKLKERISAATTEVADQTFLLLVGLFGVGVLAGTAYDYYQEMFQRRTSSAGIWNWGFGSCSSCGSACGSCGGGGGCGGGCGGCGGD